MSSAAKKRKKGPKPKADAKPAAPAADRGWYSRAELAAIFGVSISQIDRHYVQICPADACRKLGGGKTVYRARAIIDAVVSAEVDKKGLTAGVDGAGPEYAGPDTPALEELRKVKVAQERIKLAEMERKTVPLEQIEPPLLDVAAVFRRGSEALVARFGNEAGEMLGEMIDEWVAGCEKQLLGNNGN